MRIIFLFFLFSLVACGYEKDPIGDLRLSAVDCIHQKFFGDEGAILGYSNSMSLAQLEEKRKGFNLFESGNEIVDSIPFCGDSSSYAEVTLLLSEGCVADIQVLFFLSSDLLLQQVRTSVLSELTSKYGEASQEQDIFSWQEYQSNRLVQVEFSDVTHYYKRASLKLIFFTAGDVSV